MPYPSAVRAPGESTLQGRDLDGDLSTFEAYYDTVLDITWLANANYAGTTIVAGSMVTIQLIQQFLTDIKRHNR